MRPPEPFLAPPSSGTPAAALDADRPLLGSRIGAYTLNEEALAIRREAALADDDDRIAVSAHNLSEAYRHAGRFEKAEALFREAREIYESSRGPDFYLLGCRMSRALGANLVAQKKHPEAIPQLQEALRLRERLDGPADPRTQAVRTALDEARQEGS